MAGYHRAIVFDPVGALEPGCEEAPCRESGSENAVERQWQGSGKAVARQWKGTEWSDRRRKHPKHHRVPVHAGQAEALVSGDDRSELHASKSSDDGEAVRCSKLSKLSPTSIILSLSNLFPFISLQPGGRTGWYRSGGSLGSL